MKHETEIKGFSGLRSDFVLSAKPTLTVDVEKYQAMLDDSGLSDDEKKQFIEAIWSIVVNFIDWGFEVHPLQEVCGKDDFADSEHAKPAFDAVSLEHPEPD